MSLRFFLKTAKRSSFSSVDAYVRYSLAYFSKSARTSSADMSP